MEKQEINLNSHCCDCDAVSTATCQENHLLLVASDCIALDIDSEVEVREAARRYILSRFKQAQAELDKQALEKIGGMS